MKTFAFVACALLAGVAAVHARSLNQIQVCDNSITKVRLTRVLV
jgi:hypothetical protein